MESVTTIRHFGNWVRWHVEKPDGPSGFCRRHDIALPTFEKLFQAATADGLLRMRPRTQALYLEALGFDSMSALDVAWQKEELPVFPKPTRPKLPAFAAHQEKVGQLRVLNAIPMAIIKAIDAVTDRDALLAIAMALPDDVLREALGEDERPTKTKGRK